MSDSKRTHSPIYTFLPVEVEGFDSLAELALDMRWAWNHSADEVWKQLDPVLWDLTHNPWILLQTSSRDRLETALADTSFRRKVDDLLKAKHDAARSAAWFQQEHEDAPLTAVAYFSMEFMLSEALPIYSGGLGNVAGDQLKAANDLGVPVIGVGLLYQQGYFRQVIDRNGSQQALFPYNDPGQLPITPLREPNGEWMRQEIRLPGYSLWLRAWQVEVGRVKLYLLDSNDAANFPAHRGITSELYGGGPEQRLQQEIILGLCGTGAGPHLHERVRPTLRSGACRDARRQPLYHPYAGGSRVRSLFPYAHRTVSGLVCNRKAWHPAQGPACPWTRKSE
jgi:starch phosphorylase